MSWIINTLFGTLLDWLKEWIADEILKAMERDRAFEESDDKGKRIADRVKEAKTEKEKRDAAKDIADNSF